MYRKFVKRFFDVSIALLGLLIFSPLFLIISIAVKFDSPGPVLFRQKRIKKDKDFFYILKYRTMKTETPKDLPAHLLSNPDCCVTRVGRILRRTSLDEIPQLFNILSGSMSIVGPRPALYNQFELIEERDKYEANSVQPGLTGWGQVQGRNEESAEVKASWDGFGVQNMSFLFDAKCFFFTIRKMFHSGVITDSAKQFGESLVQYETEAEGSKVNV